MHSPGEEDATGYGNVQLTICSIAPLARSVLVPGVEQRLPLPAVSRAHEPAGDPDLPRLVAHAQREAAVHALHRELHHVVEERLSQVGVGVRDRGVQDGQEVHRARVRLGDEVLDREQADEVRAVLASVSVLESRTELNRLLPPVRAVQYPLVHVAERRVAPDGEARCGVAVLVGVGGRLAAQSEVDEARLLRDGCVWMRVAPYLPCYHDDVPNGPRMRVDIVADVAREGSGRRIAVLSKSALICRRARSTCRPACKRPLISIVMMWLVRSPRTYALANWSSDTPRCNTECCDNCCISSA